MAIFTAEKFGQKIQRCLLNGKDVTHLATRCGIPAIPLAEAPPSEDVLTEISWTGAGWIDILDTDNEGYFIAGADNAPVITRHYGIVKLEWTNA